jgi:hypothetical protein
VRDYPSLFGGVLDAPQHGCFRFCPIRDRDVFRRTANTRQRFALNRLGDVWGPDGTDE